MKIPALPPEPARVISGWALRWGETPTINCPHRGLFVERILPSAFDEAIASGCIELWIDHDARHGLIASQRHGTLRVQADAIGLWLEADIANTSAGDDALNLARGSGYRGASVGMTGAKSAWSAVNGVSHRTITAAGLSEISMCRRGAYQSGRLAAGRMGIEALRRERRELRMAMAEAALLSH